MPADQFKEFYDLELSFSGLQDKDKQNVFGDDSISFRIRKD